MPFNLNYGRYLLPYFSTTATQKPPECSQWQLDQFVVSPADMLPGVKKRFRPVSKMFINGGKKKTQAWMLLLCHTAAELYRILQMNCLGCRGSDAAQLGNLHLFKLKSLSSSVEPSPHSWDTEPVAFNIITVRALHIPRSQTSLVNHICPPVAQRLHLASEAMCLHYKGRISPPLSRPPLLQPRNIGS